MEWISVEDRLPEEKHEVIIYYTWLTNQNSYIGIAFVDSSLNKWFSDDGKTTFKMKEVTHWMPLPNQPKEG